MDCFSDLWFFGGIGDLICCGGWDICSNASCDFGGLLMVYGNFGILALFMI